MDLRGKYAYAIDTAKKLGFQGAATQEGDKLHFKGTVHSEDEKNQIWNAIKTIPSWQSDITADITVVPQPQAVGTSGGGASQRSYTVKSGDTLSKIAKEFYGDANAYHRIFDANRDKLKDPNKIDVGQVLNIPA
ncbi:MAG TPA: LysM peptidoglycan-binding domain-containing protein [Vicinamibacterales bacterium]|jgi:nucleoid-associated protein YgaU|nr:LysM peptidoglycan-binding domain-containing protein [Vicinamibacterales bacterium]